MNVQNITIPNYKDIISGVKAFETKEPRDAMYKLATFLIEQLWGDPYKMSNALGVLLLTWNQAFYRYGPFNYNELEKCIRDHLKLLTSFRSKNIKDISDSDFSNIKKLFLAFLDSLRIEDGPKKGIKSPVSVAKALHLLAPNFFPLWDKEIAKIYKCDYKKDPQQKYLKFCRINQQIVKTFQDSTFNNKTILNAIDEYNYS